MESFVNSSNDTGSIKIFDESSYNDLYSDVPLVATYLKILLLLIAIPAIVTPAIVIIHIIRITEELHTRYCLLLTNLFIGDILSTVRYCFEIFIMVLYLLNVRICVSEIAYAIISIPRVTTHYCFFFLAIDRVIGVAFPYRYRNIMRLKVVYVLIAFVWIIAAILIFLARLLGTPYLVWPFGIFIPQSSGASVFFAYLLPQIVSAILIMVTNAYLYRSIIQSKKKLEDNLKLSGRDEHKISKLQQLIHNLQIRFKSSAPVFVLGGVDCVFNILRVIIFITVNVFFPLSSDAAIGMYLYQFFANPLEYCQIISHSVTYGVYKKKIRKKIQKKLGQYYQGFQRLFPLRPSRVVTLHP